MRHEAETWWLVSGSDVTSSYFFKRKSVLHLNHEIPTGTGNHCYQLNVMLLMNFLLGTMWYFFGCFDMEDKEQMMLN